MVLGQPRSLAVRRMLASYVVNAYRRYSLLFPFPPGSSKPLAGRAAPLVWLLPSLVLHRDTGALTGAPGPADKILSGGTD